MTKDQIRKQIAQGRRSLTPDWIAQASLKIVHKIEQLDIFKQAQTIALYKAIAGEVDLEPLFPICWEKHKCTAIPVFDPIERKYSLSEVNHQTRYISAKYGIQEPELHAPLNLFDVDLILVPGVAFSLNGQRLGRGGGYYDRLMEGYKGKTIGVAFNFQITPTIPSESHDIPVNIVITEIL